jgi:hypothetical protein
MPIPHDEVVPDKIDPSQVIPDNEVQMDKHPDTPRSRLNELLASLPKNAGEVPKMANGQPVPMVIPMAPIAGVGGNMTAPLIQKATSTLGQIGTAGLEGAIQAGLPGAVGGEDISKTAIKSAGGGLGGLLGGAFAKGFSKVSDVLGQKASGLKDYITGRGNTLLDEGVPSFTREGAQNAIQKSLATRGGQLEEAVGGIKGAVDSMQAGKVIDEAGSQFITRGGNIPNSVIPEVNMIATRAEDVAARGATSPLEALDYKRIAQIEGWSKEGNPMQNLGSDLARREAGAYGKALEDAYGSQNQGIPNAVQEANKKLSAVLDVKRALSGDESLSKALDYTTQPTTAALAYAAKHAGSASKATAKALGSVIGRTQSKE